MRAGEYVGADGDLRRWIVQDPVVKLNLAGAGLSGAYSVRVEDLRPAAAALLALADELETEYVELAPAWRVVLVNGEAVRVESCCHVGGEWLEPVGNAGALSLAAFRAGQERGQR